MSVCAVCRSVCCRIFCWGCFILIVPCVLGVVILRQIGGEKGHTAANVLVIVGIGCQLILCFGPTLIIFCCNCIERYRSYKMENELARPPEADPVRSQGIQFE